MRILPLIAVLLFLGTGFGQAQQQTGSLSEIKLINLTVAVTDSAKFCGVTEQMIRDAAMYPISSTRLSISNPESGEVPTLGIAVSTFVGNSGLCASSIEFELAMLRPLQLPFATEARMYKIVFYQSNWHGYAMPDAHGKQIREQVELFTKKFVTTWNLDNNKPQ